MRSRANRVFAVLAALTTAAVISHRPTDAFDRFERDYRRRCGSAGCRGALEQSFTPSALLTAPAWHPGFDPLCVGIDCALHGGELPLGSTGAGIAPPAQYASLRSGINVETSRGLAMRLAVYCPGDTLITVNGEQTTSKGRTRYLDLPLSQDGQWLTYEIEGFVRRDKEWKTFQLDGGYPVSLKHAGRQVSRYQLPNDAHKLVNPLVYRDDDRPKPDVEPMTAAQPFFFAAAFSDAAPIKDTPKAATPPAAAKAPYELPKGFRLTRKDSTEKLRLTGPEAIKVVPGAKATDKSTETSLSLSPIVLVHVAYEPKASVKTFELASPLVTDIPITFEDTARKTPAFTTPTSISFKIYVNGSLNKDGKLEADEAYADLQKEVTVKFGMPTFNKWESVIKLNLDSDKENTLWEAIHDRVKEFLSETAKATHLVVELTLRFKPAAGDKDDLFVVQNYIILLLHPKP